MKKIFIFGDSFSTNSPEENYISLLRRHYPIENFSSNGSSQHRIYKNYLKHKHKIANDDIVLFCHTSPYRVYLKDSGTINSRSLETHKTCDLLFNDVFTKQETTYLNLLKEIWDEDFFLDTHNLIIDKLITVPNSIHYTFFQSDKIVSYYDVWQNHKGTINHCDEEAHRIIYALLMFRISNAS